MPNENKEPKQDGLENLSESDRKETEEILKEIDGAATPPAPAADKPAEGAKPPEDKKPEDKKPADGAPADGKPADGKPEDKKPAPRKPIKLMPTYVHEIEKGKLTKEIERLTTALAGKGPQKDGKPAPTADDVDAEIKALADKHGFSEEFAKDLLAISIKKIGGVKLPEGLEKKLETVDAMQAERETEKAEKEFSDDFSTIVLPLIKAEYGADVPDSVVADIKANLKEKSVSAGFENVPYEILYKGDDTFRGAIAAKGKGAEGGRGGTFVANGAGEKKEGLDLTKPLPDEVVKELSDKDFDTYSSNMEKSEHNR